MTDNNVRWAILGTANIAQKNWLAIRNTGNATLVGVASRDLQRSRQFIQACQASAPMAAVPRAWGSYQAALESPDVDAVYIPLPTGLRKEWVIRAARAGKHILCEKPCAPTVAELREMLEVCRQQQVQFMDGVMFMHSRRLQSLRQVLDEGSHIGQIKRLASGFSFAADPSFFEGNIRGDGSLEPLGCLGDLGWYCVRFFLWATKWQLPRQVVGRTLSQSTRPGRGAPVPSEFSAELLFADGVSASFYCSFLTELQQWVHLSGTRGCLEVGDFVLPYFGSELEFAVHNPVHQVDVCDFNMERHTRRYVVAEYGNSHRNAQETNLFRRFSELVLSGRPSEEWFEFALKTQQVVNACIESAQADGKPVSLQ